MCYKIGRESVYVGGLKSKNSHERILLVFFFLISIFANGPL